MVDVRPLAAWMVEREAVRLRKAVLERWPAQGMPELAALESLAWNGSERDALTRIGYWEAWGAAHLTNDPILQQYRFCNVRREDDRVTRWIHEHIRVPYAEHPHLWLMLAIARTINWPPTLAELMANPGAWPGDDDWWPSEMGAILQHRQRRGEKLYTGAYMIRAESDPAKPWYHWTKQRYIAEVVIGRLWELRDMWHMALSAPSIDDGMQPVWEHLQEFVGWGPFMAYQVVVDMRHTRYLWAAPDINTWAALGPGSRRGLNRLHGRPVKAPLSQEDGLREMLDVRAELIEMQALGELAPWLDMATIELSDVQNCLCEFDKYERARFGEGRPRALYVPGRGS